MKILVDRHKLFAGFTTISLYGFGIQRLGRKSHLRLVHAY